MTHHVMNQMGHQFGNMIGWFVIVPFSLAALASGLVQSLGTEWGLSRHYWILVKFLLTIGGVTVLLLHMPAVSRMAGATAGPAFFSTDFGGLRHPTFVLHAAGGLLVLVAATALSLYKQWGMTQYGRRKISQPVPPPRACPILTTPALRSTADGRPANPGGCTCCLGSSAWSCCSSFSIWPAVGCMAIQIDRERQQQLLNVKEFCRHGDGEKQHQPKQNV